MNERFRERFSVNELTALRNDLLQGGLIDSREAAELLQVFLMGRGYGVSPQAAFDAAGRSSGVARPGYDVERQTLAYRFGSDFVITLLTLASGTGAALLGARGRAGR